MNRDPRHVLYGQFIDRRPVLCHHLTQVGTLGPSLESHCPPEDHRVQSVRQSSAARFDASTHDTKAARTEGGEAARRRRRRIQKGGDVGADIGTVSRPAE